MKIEDAYEKLFVLFGSHSAAARAVGIDVSYYRKLRHKRLPMPTKMEELILLKTRDILDKAKASNA